MKPYSGACEQNRQPILEVLTELLATELTESNANILEVGSGTGQHAVYFAEALPQVTWQCSDQPQYHPGIQAWLDEAQLANINSPLNLNVSKDSWPPSQFDVLYCANVMHIMHWQNVVDLFANGAKCIKPGGLMVCYGPFNFDGKYTSASNAQFDQYLHSQDPESGIRNFEDLQQLAEEAGLTFLHDYEMPANNRILVWQKQ